MADTPLYALSLAEQARLVRQRRASPVELTQAHLARIRDTEPRLNSFILLDEEGALRQAREAERQIASGRYLGPLHGVPMALKDLYDTAGMATTGGMQILRERVPDRNATTTALLVGAGAVLLGKLNLHEAAFGVTTVNPHYGPTRNPWILKRVPGGSSGGSASAVASGQAAYSLGSDTGGSIRIPASLCGITGLKPTYGLVSRSGVLPLSWSLDHAGPMTRTAEDAALVLAVIAGYDPTDPASVDAPVPDYAAELQRPVRGLRLGVPHTYFEDLDPQVERATRAAIQALAGLGLEVRDVEIPSARTFASCSSAILYAEAAAVHHRDIRARPQDYGEDVRERLRLGMLIDATDYVQAQRARRALCKRVGQAMRDVDLLVTPSVPVQTPPIEGSGLEAQRLRAHLTRFSRPFNVTGLPACSIPCGFTNDGMPIGLQLAGRPLEDAAVLRAAHAYQQVTDWHRRRPPV